MKFSTLITGLILGASQAQASDLKIVTDIAPIGSLVSQVTGQPVTVLVAPGQSPHDASLKPSMARALQDADVVIWMGEAMAPGLEKPIEELAKDAKVLELMGLEGIGYLEFREEATFEDEHDDHEDHDDHKNEHAEHDDHDDDKDEHAEHEDHAEHDEHHHHEGLDPHAWLSTTIAQAWIGEISDVLTQANPDHQALFAMQSAAAITNIKDVAETFKGITSDRPVVALHDAFQYLEQEIGLNVLAAITDADETAASVARVSDVTQAVAENSPTCLISDTAGSGGAASRMAETLGLKLVPLDILGANQTPGPELYTDMMKKIANDLKECL